MIPLQLIATVSCFRDLTHYKGEPDPFKGDVPNQRVRDSAKEALDAIFAATTLNPPTISAPLQVAHYLNCTINNLLFPPT